jgi:hypothetical protein
MYNFSLPKVDGVSTQPAAEMNSVFNELEGIVTDTGQALSNGDNTQLEKAVSIYAAGGDVYTDSGAANAYVVSVIGSKIAPPAYFDGMKVSFLVGNTNTGASTINVASLGVKNIKRFNGTGSISDLSANDLLKNNIVTLCYLSIPACFVLVQDVPYYSTRYYLNAAQSVGATSIASIEFDTAVYDNTGGFYDTGTNKFTPVTPCPVRFCVGLNLGISNALDANAYLLEISLNGAARATSVVRAGAAGSIAFHISDIFTFNGTTDYLEFKAENFSGSSMALENSTNRTFFYAYRI